jgi:hypothetical protein
MEISLFRHRSPDRHPWAARTVGHTGTVSNSERVVPYDLGQRWSANGSPRLLQESTRAVLVLGPHSDDEDRSLVAIQIHDCDGVWLGPPNDEARSGHRLDSVGLADCAWAGEVLNSEWVSQVLAVNSAHPRHTPGAFTGLRHWILLFKENTAECLGTSLRVRRISRMSGLTDLFGDAP